MNIKIDSRNLPNKTELMNSDNLYLYIKEIATYFANNPDKSKLQVSRQFGFHSTVVLDQLLKKACVELIISDKVYKAIINRALRYSKDLEQTMQFFNQVTRCRLEAKTLKDEPPSAF